jgi:hypothetical protein
MVLAVKQYSGVDRFLLLPASAFCFWMAVRGVSTGEVPLKISTLRRSDGVLLFWFGIGMNTLLGVVCLLGFIFGLDIWK